MRDTHVVLSETPLVQGRDYTALCGAVVVKAEFGFMGDMEMSAVKVLFKQGCETCVSLVNSVKGLRYIYGAIDGQAYHDAQVKAAQRKLEKAREKAKNQDIPQVTE